MAEQSTTESLEQAHSSDARAPDDYGEATWGPWLFRGLILISLLFSWWLVIYDHGVASHH